MMTEQSHTVLMPVASANGHAARALDELRQEIVGGLLYAHGRANANTSRILEAASFLYALIETLDEKGVISIKQLDERQPAVAERVQRRFLDKGMGAHLQDPEQDKYTFQNGAPIDCENRVHLCQAACCRLWFPLSKQDVDEGVVRWDLAYPYIIAQDEDKYCRHLDRGACHCTIYQQRPLPCRAFDCRQDKRIWLDFDNKVINPDLDTMFREPLPTTA
jgi:hypothetical protein